MAVRLPALALLLVSIAAFAEPPAVSPERVEHAAPALDPFEPLAAAGDAAGVVIGWTEGFGVYAKALGSAAITPLPRGANPRGGANRISIGKLGDSFLAAYIDTLESPMRIERPLVAVRMRSDASLIDTVPLRLSDDAETAKVVTSSTLFHVFSNRRDELLEVRISPGGTPQTPFSLVTGVGDASTLVRSGGWFGWLLHGRPALVITRSPAYSILFARRSIEGGPMLGAAGAESSTTGVATPALAASETAWLMVWNDKTEVRAAFVGAVRPITIARSTVDLRSPMRAIWDGRQFLIAWSEFREDRTTDIRGATLTSDGVVGEPFLIAGSADSELQPVLLPLGDGSTLVVYQRQNGREAVIASRTINAPSRRRSAR